MSTTIVGHCFCTILHLHFIHRDMYVCVTHTYICDDDIHTCGRGRRTRERVLGALGIRSSWRGQKWPLSQMQAFMNHLSFRLPSSTQHSETYTCERMCLSHLRRAEIDTLLFRQWLVVKQCQQVSLESLIERIAWLISSPHLSVFINQKLHVNGIECVCVCVIVCH